MFKGLDGLAFIADCKNPKRAKAQLDTVKEQLFSLGYDPKRVPMVVHLEHCGDQDTPKMSSLLGLDTQPVFRTDARSGQALFQGLKGLAKGALMELKREANKEKSGR